MGNIRIAYRTLQAIEDEIHKDQGSKYRGWLGKVIPHIGDAYREGEEGHRSHLGASLVGGECPRAIWYNFRWAAKPSFSGRMLRLFNRGHLEEARFIAILLTIGCQVYQQDANGKQFRISWAEGHAGGSGDGVVSGIPDLAPDAWALSEFKTHGSKSFLELAGKSWRKHLETPERVPFDGKGVRDAKFEHYVQMQTYMHKMGLAVALYMAVNKDTDDIYAEIVVYDRAVAEQFLERGEKLVWMAKPPTKLNMSPGFYKCMFCDYKGVCHLKETPDRNCRTCEYSAPGPDAKWFCSHPDRATVSGDPQEISKETQFKACPLYFKKKDL